MSMSGERRSTAFAVVAGIGLAVLLGAWSIAVGSGRTALQAADVNEAQSAAPIVVFAAASLKNALDDVAAHFTASYGADVRLSYAGSSRLARQIAAGAPADVFISANHKWMDVLETRGAIAADSRHDILNNSLVLIAHGAAKAPDHTASVAEPALLDKTYDLQARLGDGRLAVGMTDAVPAGIYAKAALTSLGLWTGIARRMAETDSVRSALLLVARGEAPLGIVYATDATASDTVHVVGRFPATSHPPITYPAALTTHASNSATAHAAASAFLTYLTGANARAIFARHGFKPLFTGKVMAKATETAMVAGKVAGTAAGQAAAKAGAIDGAGTQTSHTAAPLHPLVRPDDLIEAGR